jgi:hypothetical protein
MVATWASALVDPSATYVNAGLISIVCFVLNSQFSNLNLL